MIAIKSVAAYALSVLVLASLSIQTQAQQLYRIVGPDGKVTFSDQPPPSAAKAKVTAGAGGKFDAAGTSGNPALPLELRTAVTKFPVTLYTGKDCAPCNTGRTLLTSRGIPFTEKTIESNEDIEALRRLTSESSLPAATIGGQLLKGYSEQDWSQYLDAAGYPKTSKLPAAYRNPATSPLVARAPAPAPAAAAAPQAAPVNAAAPAAPAPANPAGIKF